MKISLAELLSTNNPKESMQLVSKYGLTPSRNSLGLEKQINYLIRKHKATILTELADIHPHKDLILTSLKSKFEGDEFSNIESQEKVVEKNDESKNKISIDSDFLVKAGIVTLCGFILIKSLR